GDNDVINFRNLKGELIEAVEVSTEDTKYLVKISSKLERSMANFDDEDDDDGLDTDDLGKLPGDDDDFSDSDSDSDDDDSDDNDNDDVEDSEDSDDDEEE